MTIVATLSTIPVQEGESSTEIAAAIRTLDNYDVSYEINPMGTIIEASEIGELFAAVQAAHQAIEADKVNTKLEINHERTRNRDANERVTAVESVLGDNEDDLATGGATEATKSDSTADNVERKDTVDMSGHAPEEVEEEDTEQNTPSVKGGDYKTSDVDDSDEEPISERYSNSNDNEGSEG